MLPTVKNRHELCVWLFDSDFSLQQITSLDLLKRIISCCAKNVAHQIKSRLIPSAYGI